MKFLAWLVLLSSLLAACAPAGAPQGAATTPLPLPATRSPTPRPTLPPPTPGPTSAPTPQIYRVISVSLRVRGEARVSPELDAGTTTTLELAFEPVILALTRRADGSLLSSSTNRWENAPVAEQRSCLGLGASCAPPEVWKPFQPLATREIKVDWLGPRTFILWAEFRDAQGQSIPSIRTTDFTVRAQTETSLTILAKVNPATPPEKLPPPVRTALAATRSAFPVSGSVLIENGRCCAGGVAGSKVKLKVDFSATSTSGAVKEMKVQIGGSCVRDPALLKGEWEPFQPSRSYEAALAINWLGWWISVQYRDSAGNLSPVYCDDISLEGSPPSPTP